jgi:zinc transport system substrate-binding protein
MKSLRILLLAACAIPAALSSAHADVKVIASIKPVHSLVAAVMEGTGEPTLIVEGAASPHTYSMKPSRAAALQDAGIVFWVSEYLEQFLKKPVSTIGARAVSVELIDTPGLKTLGFRQGAAFEPDDDGDQAGPVDPHIWLDPENAKVMVGAIAAALAEADPDHSAEYRRNAEALTKRLDALETEISTELAGLKDKRFIVFHDGYHYFEARFGVTAVGSIVVEPDAPPSPERVSEIRQRLKDDNVSCVFAEPQFEPKLVSVVIEGTGARSAMLDPLGATLQPGPDLYFDLIRAMAGSIRSCLSGEG